MRKQMIEQVNIIGLILMGISMGGALSLGGHPLRVVLFSIGLTIPLAIYVFWNIRKKNRTTKEKRK